MRCGRENNGREAGSVGGHVSYISCSKIKQIVQ